MMTFKQYLYEVKRDDTRAMKLGAYLAKRHTKYVPNNIPQSIKFFGPKHQPAMPRDTAAKQYERQYAGKGDAYSYWASRPVVDVPVKDLNTTQDDTAFTSSHAIAKFADNEPIRIVKHKGEHFIWDGHHRYMVAKLRGNTHIKARLSDLDAD